MREVVGILLLMIGMVGVFGIVGGLELNTLTLSASVYSSIGFGLCMYLGILAMNKRE
jgi:hypothetical protein